MNEIVDGVPLAQMVKGYKEIDYTSRDGVRQNKKESLLRII